jgi:acyl-CoA synthetase (NDP forming)
LEIKSNTNSLELLFKPKSVLIFEAKPKIAFFIEGFIRQGFDLEKLYLVSAREDEILGIKCYKSIDDVPANTIDLLILSIRRELIVQNLKDLLSKKKINFIHIFTAGTAESGEVGIKVERDLKEVLMNYPETRSIGPNCMGLYCLPIGRFAFQNG